MAINDQSADRVYRQGVLLGMTMAEIMILLLFCFLMAFAFRIEKLSQDSGKDGDRLEKIYTLLEVPSRDFDDAWKKLDALIKSTQGIGAKDLSEVVSAVKEMSGSAAKDGASMVADLRKSLSVAKSVKDLMKLDSLSEHPVESVINELKKMSQDADRYKAIEALGGVAKLSEAAVKAKELTLRNERLEGAVKKLEDDAKSVGRGLGYPSCFKNEMGTLEPVFTISFAEDSFILSDLPLSANNLSEKNSLPFSGVPLDVSISRSTFLEKTMPLYLWSVDNKCRFFVDIIDKTAADRKDAYKLKVRDIESRFYKNKTL